MNNIELKTYYVRNGLLFFEDNKTCVNVFLADKIAESNGFLYAERLVKTYGDCSIKIDDKLKIVEKITKISK